MYKLMQAFTALLVIRKPEAPWPFLLEAFNASRETHWSEGETLIDVLERCAPGEKSDRKSPLEKQLEVDDLAYIKYLDNNRVKPLLEDAVFQLLGPELGMPEDADAALADIFKTYAEMHPAA